MATKPNIVFILADNLGWGDLACYGGTVPTPRLDALASEGIRLKNYNIEAQCTPTRSAILTGRMPVRTGCSSVPLPGQGHYGLAPWEYTLGELFSDAGYATALYGKWHVGEAEGQLPTDQGFDEWWGIKNTSDESGYTAYPMFAETGMEAPKIWEGKKGSPSRPTDDFTRETRPLMDERITERTVEFIKRNAAAATPFFVYVGLTNMHPPGIPNPKFKGKSGGSDYADMVTEIDFRTGQILDALAEAGIEEDTIVIFSSDNPAIMLPAMGGSSGPWRGSFGSGFEGSMRVPAMVRWPGKVPSGVVSDEIVAALDWLPTLAAMIGESARVPTDRPIDGVDSSDFLLGRSGKAARDYFIFFGSDGGVFSVKWRNIKVVFRYCESPMGPIFKLQAPMAFDLIEDPREQWDVTQTRMDNLWMYQPAIERLMALEKSMARFPNIKPGEEFGGYPTDNAESEKVVKPAQ